MSADAKWSHHEQALPEGTTVSSTALDDAEKGIYDNTAALPVIASPPVAYIDEKKALEAVSTTDGTVTPPSPPPAAAKKPAKPKPSRWILFQLWFNTYRKFFTFVTVLNLVGIAFAAADKWDYARNHLGALVLGNLLMAVLMRNELFLRFLYLISIYGLRSWAPVCIKIGVTSILQHVGGIHSGCALSGAAWLIYKIVDIIRYRAMQHSSVIASGIITNVAVIISVLSAVPWIRKDTIASLGGLVSRVLIPWVTLREVPVEVEIPSPKVAILKFQRGMQQGLLGRISRTSIMEYHAFGIISEGRKSGCHYMICGVQGDFTKDLVADPPKTPALGTPRPMFKRGIRICTGTGIGAALSTCIQSPDWFLIWIGSDQEKTFGPTITGLIYNNIPPERMILWDSKKRGGRPDSVKLLKEVWDSFGAEVIFITSNMQGNDEMMQGCRAAGLHAFGTLWDF
ncbi:hypothetical protein CHGG_00227 [Chaetomium globosum CBS 148.51]|uniref:Non-ribosomal peptide synthetase n=1 Tax=Chaetomium globosum (strain ATCC 6205 / CBS 148.51 / DSM 1962 / NBRC 6347 / NRRL 1970) TaxID=306901 RepID=Q2HHS7_CHAGB|nr:uncharacterized protein CHGG_00227 [Chaetomium globosum CBS 148.51]EAQ91992.1 hypothetical protein CHGG_00227 [Chaetomium globosum CBS 148.51]